MTSPWPAWIVALLFGCAAYLGIRASAALCATIEPFDDGPTPGEPPSVGLVVGATLVGATLATRGLPLAEIGVFALLIVSLVAAWYSDVRCGIVPDSFTLVPLGLVIAISLVERQPSVAISAALVAIPFGLAAFVSKGRGLGWGDVKLVALGAAVLGLRTSVLAFAAASTCAVAIAVVRRKRSEPIAFVPYLAGAMALALAVPVLP